MAIFIKISVLIFIKYKEKMGAGIEAGKMQVEIEKLPDRNLASSGFLDFTCLKLYI